MFVHYRCVDHKKYLFSFVPCSYARGAYLTLTPLFLSFIILYSLAHHYGVFWWIYNLLWLTLIQFWALDMCYCCCCCCCVWHIVESHFMCAQFITVYNFSIKYTTVAEIEKHESQNLCVCVCLFVIYAFTSIFEHQVSERGREKGRVKNRDENQVWSRKHQSIHDVREDP